MLSFFFFLNEGKENTHEIFQIKETRVKFNTLFKKKM